MTRSPVIFPAMLTAAVLWTKLHVGARRRGRKDAAPGTVGPMPIEGVVFAGLPHLVRIISASLDLLMLKTTLVMKTRRSLTLKTLPLRTSLTVRMMWTLTLKIRTPRT